MSKPLDEFILSLSVDERQDIDELTERLKRKIDNLLLSIWFQFSTISTVAEKQIRHDGGLSVLNELEEYLKEEKLINQAGF